MTRVFTGDHDGDGIRERNRDTVLDPIMNHRWSDDGRAAGRLVDWMSHEYFRNSAEPGFIHDESRAGRMTRATFEYFVAHDAGFMDMHGANSSNIGQVNPWIMRSLSAGAMSIIPILGDAPNISGSLPGWDAENATSDVFARPEGHENNLRSDTAERYDKWLIPIEGVGVGSASLFG